MMELQLISNEDGRSRQLQVWLEQNGMLQGELQCSFTLRCNIQEESAAALDTETGGGRGQCCSAAGMRQHLSGQQGVDGVKTTMRQPGVAWSIDDFSGIWALFSLQKFCFLATVALLFLFDKHCPITK